ncbi:hypothetical protein Tco_1269190, partial [Tanacetum coccineum]
VSPGYGILVFFPLWSLVSAGTDTPYLLDGYGVLRSIDILELFVYAPKCVPFSITSPSWRRRGRKCTGSSTTKGQDRAKKKGAASSTLSASGNEEALTKLMVNEYASLNEPYNARKSQDREAFLEIRMKELGIKEQKLRMREYEQRQKDEMFYIGDEAGYHGEVRKLKFFCPSKNKDPYSHWRSYVGALVGHGPPM